LILLDEANLSRVADPAAGAGGFEALTDAFCEKAWGLFQEIEREGTARKTGSTFPHDALEAVRRASGFGRRLLSRSIDGPEAWAPEG
jgi:methylmalonyl-CoA mutase N-terminal domain/subunit